MSKPATITRALPLDVRATAAKTDVLAAIHRDGVHCVRDNLRVLRRGVQETGTVPERMNTTTMADTRGLPARYRAELSNNAIGPAKSWRSHVIADGNRCLRGSSIPKNSDLYRVVNRLISFGHGLGKPRELEEGITDGLSLTSEQLTDAVDLARRITRRQVSRHDFPTLRGDASLTLGGKVITVSTAPTVSFDAIVTFMGLQRATPIHIPVNLPAHTRRRVAEKFTLINAIQLVPTATGVRLKAVATRTAEPRQKTGKVLGVDVGAVCPVATSGGDLFGRELWLRVQHYDRVMQRAMKGVQERGGRKHWRDAAAYRNAQRRLRGLVRNEINRVLNRLIDIHDPDELVIEKLDKVFDAVTGLSPRMRRLLRSVGRSVFRQKLTHLAEERDITVTEVNPAYTSKGCHCGNVDDRNRPRRDLFTCTRCGRKRNADIHAATMIESRRSVPELSRELGGSSHIGSRRTALAHQQTLSFAWCRERNIQPEASAGGGRELSVPDKPPKAA